MNSVFLFEDTIIHSYEYKLIRKAIRVKKNTVKKNIEK